jgi:hypothetical protein
MSLAQIDFIQSDLLSLAKFLNNSLEISVGTASNNFCGRGQSLADARNFPGRRPKRELARHRKTKAPCHNQTA